MEERCCFPPSDAAQMSLCINSVRRHSCSRIVCGYRWKFCLRQHRLLIGRGKSRRRLCQNTAAMAGPATGLASGRDLRLDFRGRGVCCRLETWTLVEEAETRQARYFTEGDRCLLGSYGEMGDQRCLGCHKQLRSQTRLHGSGFRFRELGGLRRGAKKHVVAVADIIFVVG